VNFLAHIYLSGENDLLTIGNFAADGIRGRHYLNYPSEMQAGILLHRFIDTYTDAHPIFRQSTKRLHASYGHYSGVIVDIFYDHFLASNWTNYAAVSLDRYVDTFYHKLKRHMDLLPPKFQHLSPIMIEGNWLLSYASIEGIQAVLNGMNRRTTFKSRMNEATKELTEDYEAFQNDFFNFFEDLIEASHQKRITLERDFNIQK
jgi:acyl carrier protein phosphodiesterase